MAALHNQELTVAVIGCGPAGLSRLRRWSLFSGIRIVAVCDPDGHLAAQTAGRFNCAAFEDYRKLLGPDPIDLVDICLPAPQRSEAVAFALKAGSHVLCETPIAATSIEVRTLAKLAEERERRLMPAMMLRFHPSIAYLKELIDNEDLGTPERLHLRLSRAALALSGEGVETEDKSVDPGVIRSIPQEAADLFRNLCGDVQTEYGRLTGRPIRPLAPDAALVLQGVNGALGLLEITGNLIGAANRLEFGGSAGACEIDLDMASSRSITADQPVWHGRTEGGPDPLERLTAHFSDVVRGLQQPMVTAEDQARALEICESALASP